MNKVIGAIATTVAALSATTALAESTTSESSARLAKLRGKTPAVAAS